MDPRGVGMASRFCQECGASNEATAMYCAKCGAQLRAGVPAAAPAPAATPPTAPPQYPPGYGSPPMYAPSPYPPAYYPTPAPMYPPAYPAYDYAAADHQKQVDRTKMGVLLLLVGSAIGWIPFPFVGAIGGLLVLIGAILVILGRKAFGATHSRNVVISIVLFFVGVIGVIALAVWLALAIFTAAPGNFAQLGQVFTTFVIGATIIGAISGLASVLFTYALQVKLGKILLWAGYAANLIVSAITVVLIVQLVSTSANLTALSDQLTALGLLSAIPSLLFAGAYYLAWQRITRREIPAPSAAPAAPMGWPAAGATPWAPPTSPPPAGSAVPPGPPQRPP